MAKKRLLQQLVFETEYRIVGLFCQEKDYRLCWLLNRHLSIEFKRKPDFVFETGKSKMRGSYPVFLFESEVLQLTFCLVGNRSDEGTLMFAAPRGLNYLLLIKADESRFDFQSLLKSFRSLPQITAAYLLDDVLGRGKEEFLYDFEFFLAHELKL